MRLALITDIHGNPPALDAVLSQIEAEGGVDEYWFLGDYCAIGHDPLTVLERITALPNAVFLRGNTDRYVYAGHLPDPTPESALNNLQLVRILGEVAGNFAWTQGYLARTGWLEWLEALPLEHRATLPDGTRVLAVHATPGRDDSPGVHPGLEQPELDAILAEADAELLIVGHTHAPQDYALPGGRIVNPGSVGNPLTGDVRAAYAILNADAKGHTIELKRAEYDVAAVLAELKRLRHPAAPYISRFYNGYKAAWKKTGIA